jgi:hypothetical protein
MLASKSESHHNIFTALSAHNYRWASSPIEDAALFIIRGTGWHNHRASYAILELVYLVRLHG